MRNIINVLMEENGYVLREDRNDLVRKGNLVGEVIRDVATNKLFLVVETETLVNCHHCGGSGECDISHKDCWGRMDRQGSPHCNRCGGCGEEYKYIYSLEQVSLDEANDITRNYGFEPAEF